MCDGGIDTMNDIVTKEETDKAIQSDLKEQMSYRIGIDGIVKIGIGILITLIITALLLIVKILL